MAHTYTFVDNLDERGRERERRWGPDEIETSARLDYDIWTARDIGGQVERDERRARLGYRRWRRRHSRRA